MRGWRCSAWPDVGFASFSMAAPPLCALRRQRWLISAWDTLVGRLDAENERPPASAAHTFLSGVASEPTLDSARYHLVLQPVR